ncbi:MAG: glycosyltransferase family 2 protein [Planctomycetes bacterium]|nr:glycosyltransferase family 2 protein [Planctomycetota bacterium]
MRSPTLHVVVPVYNELKTLEPCLRRVFAVGLPERWALEVHVVDDHSDPPGAEATRNLTERLREEGRRIHLHRHDRNCGKGAALRTGFDAVLASEADDDDLVVIQDADLEYDPGDFPRLMAPVIAGEATTVIGTRWEGRPVIGLRRRVHAGANRLLTLLSNLMTGYRVTDMECCYKLMPVAVLRRVRPLLTEDRFGIEPQLVAALSRQRVPIVEVPVAYEPRRWNAGKKIGWRDGVRALYVIARERLRGPRPPAETRR